MYNGKCTHHEVPRRDQTIRFYIEGKKGKKENKGTEIDGKKIDIINFFSAIDFRAVHKIGLIKLLNND